MIQTGTQDVADHVLAIMERLGLTVEQLIERVTELAGDESRVRARDEAPTGHEMNGSFDREKWVHLQPIEMDSRDEADELDQVIALARPDLDAGRRAEVFRDWATWNIRKAEREGRIAKALRLRELFGFAKTWKPCLDLWRAARRAGRNAYGALSRQHATPAPSAEPSRPLTPAQRVLWGRPHADQGRVSEVISRYRLAGRDRLAEVMSEYACGSWIAGQIACALEQEEPGRQSPRSRTGPDRTWAAAA